MHKTRFIWLKNPWNLTEAQHRRLSELEHLNLKINRAYLLKELFAHFWTYRRAGWAKRYLKRWFWWATHSRKVGNRFAAHESIAHGLRQRYGSVNAAVTRCHR